MYVVVHRYVQGVMSGRDNSRRLPGSLTSPRRCSSRTASSSPPPDREVPTGRSSSGTERKKKTTCVTQLHKLRKVISILSTHAQALHGQGLGGPLGLLRRSRDRLVSRGSQPPFFLDLMLSQLVCYSSVQWVSSYIWKSPLFGLRPLKLRTPELRKNDGSKVV